MESQTQKDAAAGIESGMLRFRSGSDGTDATDGIKHKELPSTNNQNSTKPTFKEIFLSECRAPLTYHNQEVFCKTQWPWPPLVLLVYRVVICVYVWIWLLISVAFMPYFRRPFDDKDFKGIIWVAFLTNWSNCVLALFLTFALVVHIRHAVLPYRDRLRTHLLTTTHSMNNYRPEDCNNARVPAPHPDNPFNDAAVPPPPKTTPLDMKIAWLLFSIIADFAVIITLIYFTVLFPRLYPPGVWPHPVDFHIHGFNSIVIIIEICICAYPVRLFHMIFPVIYGLIYVAVSIGYWSMDPRQHIVYRFLDWNKPGIAISVVLGLGFVVIPLMHAIIYGIYRLRIYIHDRLYLYV